MLAHDSEAEETHASSRHDGNSSSVLKYTVYRHLYVQLNLSARIKMIKIFIASSGSSTAHDSKKTRILGIFFFWNGKED